MNEKQRMRLTGALFVLGAMLINIPYAMLIASFDYPDILRDPAGTVLVQFQAGGAGLIWQWFAFAWIGLPLLAAVLLLPQCHWRCAVRSAKDTCAGCACRCSASQHRDPAPSLAALRQ